MEDDVLIRLEQVDICRDALVVLQEVQMEIRKGEFVYLIGKVGTGKSSLLKTLYAEVPILNGTAHVFEYDLCRMKRKHIPHLRRRLGIVFQDFQLLIDRNVTSNLEFVLKATGWKNKADIETRIQEVLEEVGMENKGYKMPHELSGGEQQRIVMARALLNKPDIILADEPTGNLDPETGTEIVRLLHRIRESGTTVLMSTHNMNLVQSFPGRILKCENNRLIE
ncbi:MAG: ATP-binding cassette domain-containing protein [Bacteroidales bacterium]|jgi:cell division transport system ATP-binding protein|nr:ATP-binding cassette domain-containing protein [Bacteroidales bacterium]MDD3166365.1 ATP-binding cassette domain-containing protein [Bacteroidales bacterium]MDD3995761.1 ATP-binding cassette domain-containing protein [Bacilli bacterium]MDD4770870.1 ATP-binding cassette domain-containing protein [Bacteroidales bacterium]HKL91863.1 ATP-binding cassette domain-containing protein [Bacteroidales bacterium]